jgi:hypothetical protein
VGSAIGDVYGAEGGSMSGLSRSGARVRGFERRVLAMFLAASTALAACAGAAPANNPVSPDAATSPAASAAAGPAYEGWVEPDGSVPFASALAAVTAAFGPLHGFDPPPATTTRPYDGSAALRWITGYADRLTDVQRTSLQKLITQPSAGRPGPLIAGLVPPPVLIDDASLDSMVSELQADLEARTGHSMGAPIIPLVIDQPDRPHGAVYAFGADGASFEPGAKPGKMEHCSLWLYGPSTTFSPMELRSFVGSLVFQCWMYDQYNIEDVPRIPPWIWEGASIWAGETLVGGSPLSHPAWVYWIEGGAEVSLYERTFSAVGFFALMASAKVDPWTHVVPMADEALASGSSDAAYGLVGGPASAIEADWGPSLHRAGAQYGPTWETEGAGVPDHSIAAPPVEKSVGDGEIATLTAPALTGVPYVADLDAEVIWLEGPEVAGRITLTLDSVVQTDRTFADLAKVALCTLPGGCTCAENSVSGTTKFLEIQPGTQRVGVTGGLEGATLHLVGQTLEDFCGVCVLGQWELDNDTVTPLELLVPAPAGTGAQTALGSYGSLQMFFREDGYWQVFANGFTSHYNGAQGAGGMPFIRIRTNGKATGSYTLERAVDGEDRWTVTVVTSDSTLQTVHTTFLGREPDGVTRRAVASSTPPLSPVVAALNGPVTMTCGQDTLTIEVPTAGGPVPVLFRRPRGV